jgi:hypothetical protein
MHSELGEMINFLPVAVCFNHHIDKVPNSRFALWKGWMEYWAKTPHKISKIGLTLERLSCLQASTGHIRQNHEDVRRTLLNKTKQIDWVSNAANFLGPAFGKKFWDGFSNRGGGQHSVPQRFGQAFNPARDIDCATQYREIEPAGAANIAVANLPYCFCEKLVSVR